MKIIFLDIDGVLNVEYNEKDKYGHIFKEEYVQNLAEIIEKTGAKIVISSTWKDKGIERIHNLWLERGLPGEIIDITPDCIDVVKSTEIEFYDEVKRGDEIKLWLDRNKVDNYVIIDDIDDFLEEQKSHFVNCSTGTPIKPWKLGIPGLKEECKIKTINILNMKEKITFDEYTEIKSKLEIKSGLILSVEEVKKTDKMLKLEVDFGEETPRIVLTAIKQELIVINENFIDQLLNKSFLFITNLLPVKMFGFESQAMIVPGEIEKFGLATIDTNPGTNIF